MHYARLTLLILASSLALGVIRLNASAQAPAETSTAPVVDGADLIARFLARSDEPLRTYRALRRLSARNERFNKEGWLEAWTELDPAGKFRYEIVAEGGSGSVRNRVLRAALEGEREIVERGDQARAALTADNYLFTLASRTDDVVELRSLPRRKDRLLVDGSILLSADSADLLAVKGRLARNPSFWTSRVDVVRRYGRIQGVRVPLSVESVARVKIAGPSAFSMTYEYESINGREAGHPVSTAGVSHPKPPEH
jgi:hypothetical protein